MRTDTCNKPHTLRDAVTGRNRNRKGQCTETERRRERYVEEHRPERTRGEQLRGGGGPADLQKTKGQGREHLCDAACLHGTETLALTEIQQQRRQ